MDVNAKKSFIVFKEFLKKLENDRGYAYGYFDLFEFLPQMKNILLN
ncbi:hypothetical protein KKH96_03300 [Patescibacteria group bacterium]|nr:hypothetical protein [Patescibacteria group bacterium]